jgi:hypothetical protein
MSMFEQIANLMAERAKCQKAIDYDHVLLERIPRTLVKREALLKSLDAQLAALKAKVDAAQK